MEIKSDGYNQLGPSAKIIYDEAQKIGIEAKILNAEKSYLELSKAGKSFITTASRFPFLSAVSSSIACDKEMTNLLIDRAGIQIPGSKKVKTKTEALKIAKDVGFPLVVKPTKGAHGKGVTSDIKDQKTLETAVDIAFKYDKEILLEKHCEGTDYRLLVFNGKVIAALKRINARIFGDGKSTIEQLIEKENQNPKRGVKYQKPLQKIFIDEDTKEVLENQNMTLESIPKKDQAVKLKSRANQSLGGEIEECTDKVHPDYQKMVVDAAKALNLKLTGADVITTDITKPLKKTKGVVIEVNDAPGFQIHHFPTHGKPINVARIVLEYLFNIKNGK
ncbi:MAG: cyanophycin synthase [uncultured bacterium]|nr:MAG: cyanophycin synthase [uncultured bacterium]